MQRLAQQQVAIDELQQFAHQTDAPSRKCLKRIANTEAAATTAAEAASQAAEDVSIVTTLVADAVGGTLANLQLRSHDAGGGQNNLELKNLVAKVEGLKDTIGKLKDSPKKEGVAALVAKVEGHDDTIGKLTQRA